MLPSRLVVVREAIDTVLRHLEGVPPSDRTEMLRAWVLDCMRETEQWSVSPPTDREAELVMKRVLALHVAVTTMKRRALLAIVKGSGSGSVATQ